MLCPMCGAADHSQYVWNGVPLLACPHAPDNQISMMTMKGLDPKITDLVNKNFWSLLVTDPWDASDFDESNCAWGE